MPAPNGNCNAAKATGEKAESLLHIRCKRADKSDWVRAAKPGKLSAWVVAELNKAAARAVYEKSKSLTDQKRRRG